MIHFLLTRFEITLSPTYTFVYGCLLITALFSRARDPVNWAEFRKCLEDTGGGGCLMHAITAIMTGYSPDITLGVE
jgi:hypothetical protein